MPNDEPSQIAEASEKRTRNDRRRNVTRTSLILKAEEMFAEFGVESVSLRQIGAAIGSSNTNVVSYYFGNREGLIEAIYNFRLPSVEARRAELFAIACQSGLGSDLATLMHTQWQPLFELTDEKGRHTFGRFYGSIGRSSLTDVRVPLAPDFPVTAELHRRIKLCIPKRVARLHHWRQIATSLIITGALDHIDNTRASSGEAEQIFRDALGMAAEAMAAP